MPLATSATTERGAEAVDVDEAAHVVNKLLEHVGVVTTPGSSPMGSRSARASSANPIEAEVEPQGTRPWQTQPRPSSQDAPDPTQVVGGVTGKACLVIEQIDAADAV